MAIVSDIEIRLRADIARLQTDMTAARRTVDTATAAVSRSVDVLKSAFAGLAAGAGIKEIAGQLIGAQREFDKFNSALITATGSTAAANKAFAALQNFAATTPFDLKQTVDAFLKLRNMGLDPSERALRAYGNTAGALGKSLNQMVEAVADATTGEFERLKEFGIKAAQNGDTVRLTFQGVTTSIGNNAKDIQKYLMALGETKFGGGMELQAKTLDGAISNLGDSWQALLRTVSQSGFGDAANRGVRALSSALDTLSTQIREGGPIIEGLKLAGKLTAMYLAAMAAPAVITAFSSALATVALNLSLIKLELRAGLGLWGLFNTALTGTSVSAALAAGSLTKLQLALSILMGAFAGWDIGKYLDQNFYQARIAGEVFVGEMLKGWENIKYGAEVLWTVIKSGYTSAIGGLKTLFADFVSANAKLLGAFGAKETAKGMQEYADGVRSAAAAQMDLGVQLALLGAAHEKTIELINKETDARSAAAAIQGQISEADRQQTGDALKGIDVKAQATAQALDWYKKTMEASRDSYDQQVLELQAGQELTAEEKKRVEVLNELDRVGKSLGATEKKNIRQYQDALVVLGKTNALRREEPDLRDKRLSEAMSEVDAMDKQTQSLADQVKYYGMTEEAVLKLKAAELERKLQNEAIDQLERNRLSSLLESTQAQIGLQTKLTKMKADTAFWTSLEDAAHQAFLSIQNGGASMWQRLKDSAKTMFFDWLYQMTVRKWIISIGASISGTAGVSGIANAANTVSGASSTMFSVAGIYSAAKAAYAAISGGFEGIAAGVADGVQSIMYATGQSANILTNSAFATQVGSLASAAAGAALGKFIGGKISGQYEIGAHGSASTNVATIAGAILGGPIGGIVGGTIGGLLNRAFGMGSKNVSSTMLQGTLTPTGAAAATVQAWTQSGGWFRSDKSGTDRTALSATQTDAFASTYKAILDVSKVLGDTLGADTAALSTRVQQLNIDLTGLTDEAKQQEAIVKFFAGVGDTIAGEIVPGLQQFQAEGEALSATLQRVATDYATIDVALQSVNKSFGTVGVASIAAREHLISAAGGLDKLVSGLSYFRDNFLTDAEKLAQAQADLQKQMQDLGISSITTEEQFKQYALGLDLTNAAQADLFAKMLQLAPAFKQVTDAADAAAKASADAAAVAAKAASDLAAAKAAEELQRIADNAKLLTGAVDSALAGVSRAVAAQKAKAQSAYEALAAALDASIAATSARISDLQGLSDMLKQRATVGSAAQSAITRQVAAAAIAAAAQVAQQTGVLPAADAIRDAVGALRSDSADNYSSMLEYQRAAAAANNDIANLGSVTDTQLSVAQTSLQVLQQQKDFAKASYDAEIAGLDAQLAKAQEQVDALNGINTSVLSVRDALAAFGSAYTAAAADPTAGAGLATVTAQNKLEGLYQQYLGRSSDATGLAFWTKQATSGTSWSAIEAGFANSDEARARAATLEAAVQKLSTSMEGMQNAMNRTANSTQQLASQFDNVSAGGNALVTVNP